MEKERERLPEHIQKVVNAVRISIDNCTTKGWAAQSKETLGLGVIQYLINVGKVYNDRWQDIRVGKGNRVLMPEGSSEEISHSLEDLRNKISKGDSAITKQVATKNITSVLCVALGLLETNSSTFEELRRKTGKRLEVNQRARGKARSSAR